MICLSNIVIKLCYLSNSNSDPKLFPATLHHTGEGTDGILIMQSPKFIFLDREILFRMFSMEIKNINEDNPDISELVFMGTTCFTIGKVVGIEAEHECKISFHRYDENKYLCLVVDSRKKFNENLFLEITSSCNKRKILDQKFSKSFKSTK